MATAVKKPALDDVKIGALLLQKKIITESHLRTAIDYQRSLGGRLIDVLCKLNILRPAQAEQISSLFESEGGLPAKPHPEERHRPESKHRAEEAPSVREEDAEAVREAKPEPACASAPEGSSEEAQEDTREQALEEARDNSTVQEKESVDKRVEVKPRGEGVAEKSPDGSRRETARDEPILEDPTGEETRRVEKGRDDSVLAPDSVRPSDLKVHWRLLEKLPKGYVEEHLLLVFFPTAGVSSRKIILGHGKEISAEVRERVRAAIGVDVITLSLSPEVAKAFLSGSRQVAGDTANKSVRIVKTPQPPPQGRKDEGGLLLALVTLLSKKGVITLAELEEEFGRSRAGDKSEK